MSAPADTHTHEHPHRSVWFYLVLAVFLSIVTGIELAPLFGWFNIPPLALLVLSAVKFFCVVAFFMHLWDDAGVFSQVFGFPLVGAIAMVSVLMLMHHTFNPKPGADSFAVQERYVANFRGDCSSWLQSHRSNRTYCASPAIPIARMVRVGGGGPSWGSFTADLTTMDTAGQIQALSEFGEKIFKSECARCHQADGAGSGGYPPLASSDYMLARTPTEHARIILHGLSGPITVNGQAYDSVMPPLSTLTDVEVAAVATYERNAWGNEGGLVTPEDAAAAR